MASVRALRLLDTPPEDRFDRITRMAHDLFDVPFAMVTLIERDRQWVKSSCGLAAQEMPRRGSFCSAAVEAGELLEVPDATLDARFAHVASVVGAPFVRFYAGQPVAGPSGYLVGTLCVLDTRPRRLSAAQRASLRDLAHWVELEYSVPQATQWEQDAERARRDFVSVVSHELRTPLTSIRGSLELIESGRFGELPPQVGRLVGIAAKNTSRLVRLADDVVDLHQMRRGALRLQLATVRLPEVVEQALLAVRDVSDRAGVRMQVACDHAVAPQDDADRQAQVRCHPPAPLRGDADRLVQVVTNLLVNAIKVSPDHGTVTASCGNDGTRATVAVRDHGPGVPQGQLDEIFEPYVQFDVPGRKRGGGAGLGLAIARGIVDAHGGDLHARPAEGGGSIFEMSLPTGGPDTDVPWW